MCDNPLARLASPTLLGLMLAALAPVPALAAEPAAIPSPAASRPLAPADVFELEWASDPQISPDGREIVYARRFHDIRSDRRRSALWLVSADGTRHRPLLSNSFSDGLARWSPDGGRIAWVGADADGGAQVFVRYMDTGTVARVTMLTQAPLDLAWSPDGRSIAFVMRVPDRAEGLKVTLPVAPEGAKWAEPLKVVDRVVYRADGEGMLPEAFAQVFVVPAEGGTARQLTSGRFDHVGGMAWTRDSRALIVSVNRRADVEYVPFDSDLYRVAVADGAMTRLTDRFGPDGDPAVSRDGRIAWVGFDDKFLGYQRRRLYVMEADGSGRRELLADLDRDVTAPVFAADGRSLYFSYDDHGRTRIANVTLDGRLTQLANDMGGESWSRPYDGGSFSVARDGTFAWTKSTPLKPSEVAIGKAGRELTDLNGDFLALRQLGQVEEITFPSSADGREIQGWIVKPPGFDASKKYPLILEIHGGPFTNYGPRFALEMQLYAAPGNVVLYINPRGSTSYGEAFGNLIHHDYPGKDYDDLISGVDAVIAKGYVDPARLFVTGGSGGGVLTAWIIGKTGRFRAAAVQKPVINWASFALTADGTNFFSQYWFPAKPWEKPEEYWRRSPLSLVGNVTTPTMVVSGELDYRTPIGEAEQYFTALKLRKVDTVLVRVPGAPHSLDQRPSQLAARIQYILAWFAKY